MIKTLISSILLLSPSFLGAQGLRLQDYLLQSDGLPGVHGVNEGTILRTANTRTNCTKEPVGKEWGPEIQLEQSGGPLGGFVAALGSNPDGTIIYVGTPLSGVYFSNDDGSTFDFVANSMGLDYPRKIITDSLGWLLVLDNDGLVHRTTNMGLEWTILGDSLMNDISFDSRWNLYGGSTSGLHTFNGQSNTWDQVSGTESFSVNSIAFEPQGGIILSTMDGIYRSTDFGQSWTSLGFGFLTPDIIAINSAGHIFLGRQGSDTYRSTDHGASWETIAFPVDMTELSAMKIDPVDDDVLVSSTVEGVLRSTDNGESWSVVNDGLNFTYGIVYYLRLMIDPQGKLWAGTTGGGVYLSVDNGENWNRVSLICSELSSFDAQSDTVFAGTWTNGVFRSTDNGDTWQDISVGIPTASIFSVIVAPNGDVFVGTYASGLYKSTDSGTTWEEQELPDSVLFFRDIRSIAFDSVGNYYAGGRSGLFVSTDGGSSWVHRPNGLPAGQAVNALEAYDGTVILAGLWNGEVYRSTDIGVTWSLINASGSWEYVSDIAIEEDGKIFVGTGGGLYRSTNTGSSWEEVNEGLSDLVISTVYFGGSSDLFVATWNGGLYRSTNSGQQWVRIDEAGIPSRLKGVVVTDRGTLFVGTRGYGAFRSAQSVLTVKGEQNGIPRDLDLSQNYPNPFNPSTTIKFSIPRSGEVSLKIFNLLGEEVATLVSGNRDAGFHTVQWDATGHPSGMYFYRLRAGDFMETKKLVLVR